MYLRQSTTGEITIGPFLSVSNGVTAITSLTLDNSDIQLSKNGGGFVEKSDTSVSVHESGGWYRCLLDTTDTDTVGRLLIQSQDESVYLPVWHEFYVIEENIYDSMYAPNAAGFDANQRVDVGSWLGTAVSTSGNLPNVNVESMKSGVYEVIADNVLSRSVENVEDTASVYSLTRVVLAASNWAIQGTTGIEIRKTDGSQFALTSISGNAHADLIVTVG